MGKEIKKIIRGLAICWVVNSQNKSLAKIGADVLGGHWRKIKYSKVLSAYLFNRTKYEKLIQHLEKQF